MTTEHHDLDHDEDDDLPPWEPTLLDQLVEVLAYLTEHVDTIPEHRRRQALLGLERVERLVPVPDTDVDALEDDQ